MAQKIKVIALIVAAGTGERCGGELSKQYQPVAGVPMLRRSAEAFLRHSGVDAVRVVMHPEHGALYARAMAGLNLLPPAHGGASRQESVKRGLESLEELAPDLVLIHDAARPFVSAEVIDRVIAGLKDATAVLPCLPVADTLKRVGGGTVLETIPRAGLYAAQTPQGFRYPEILTLHRAAKTSVTDDVALYEAAGIKVLAVAGEAGNFKITTEEDMARAESMIGYETRVGTGFDVHPFEDSGAGVTLCGVKIPHRQKLKGHSDADVGLHALVDALLGAIGAGDIGQHFPPSDMKWKNADSGRFVEHTVGLVKAQGGRIINVDITIICEQPKIGAHREAMRNRVAELLEIAPERVNIKATTTEKLGFTGREEGIAAQAVASVRMAGE